MKMENALQSSIDAVVKSIRVREGQPVEKDALLIELEAIV
jgi:biotin carboxyl carrier protein